MPPMARPASIFPPFAFCSGLFPKYSSMDSYIFSSVASSMVTASPIKSSLISIFSFVESRNSTSSFLIAA
ncbi:hypothetical protein FGO68_gene768 [Halteria grandinella]|uniref:Uncharacterized protein n=1 Tax=Halteria grandinella TaxID=5974 RepID=A0A8J8NDY2_HALGN|nr:hypothetical protein FGO68_gene768 [Halteria grandinella]